MQAVILVGGEGTRLRPLTYGTPKPMVPLFGVPFLERSLARLRGAGVTEAILASGYLPQAIRDHFGDGERVGMRLSYFVEETPLGTAGAIRNVADSIDGTFFVLNGDVLTSLNLRAMLAFHRERGGLGTLHAIRVDDPSAFGCIVRDGSDRVTSFVEKPPRDEAPTNEINAGTYLLEPAVIDAIPAGRAASIERETFPQLLARGERLNSFVTSDYWLDVGRPAQYLQAHADILDGKLSLQAPGAGVVERGRFVLAGDRFEGPGRVQSPSFIGTGASIDPSAVVGPYAVLGADCRVGPGARVRDSVLWDDVEIEAGAAVSDAILATGVRVGAGAVVPSGAVIGHAAKIPANAVLSPDARISASAEEGGAAALTS
jgi:mannose-1-phosphate guanylyltransferase